jgi:drug/metabolite transporter (DMT)-like permease
VSSLALFLVLSASFIHASWNLLAKRIGGGPAVAWLLSTASLVIYAPAVLGYWLWWHPDVSALGWWFMLGTGVIHLTYYLVLQRGYNVGDLSLVYPLARGTGPLLSATGAMIFFGERPSWLALVGIALVLAGVFVISSGGHRSADPVRQRKGRLYGILTGCCIAAYTLWDKYSVATLHVPPLYQDYANSVVTSLLLAPIAWREWDAVRGTWNSHRREVLGVGFLRPLSFLFILTAMVFTPVSYVAPAREISILIGVFFGARIFSEEGMHRRMIASVLMLLGITAIAFG